MTTVFFWALVALAILFILDINFNLRDRFTYWYLLNHFEREVKRANAQLEQQVLLPQIAHLNVVHDQNKGYTTVKKAQQPGITSGQFIDRQFDPNNFDVVRPMANEKYNGGEIKLKVTDEVSTFDIDAYNKYKERTADFIERKKLIIPEGPVHTPDLCGRKILIVSDSLKRINNYITNVLKGDANSIKYIKLFEDMYWMGTGKLENLEGIHMIHGCELLACSTYVTQKFAKHPGFVIYGSQLDLISGC